LSERVGKNQVVYISYVIQGSDSEVLEQHDLPVGYVHGGNGALLEKIEAALEGKAVGDRVEVTLAPEDGFGPHRPELTFTDDLDNVPEEHRFLGSEVEFQNERGESMLFRVTRIENGKLTIDANHPLAGKTLRYVVRVEGIRPATLDEVANGVPADAPMQPLH